jgi:hypothetical protein
MTSFEVDATGDYWRFWSDDVRRAGCELYARLATGIGADTRLRAIAAQAQKGQPPANLILAAVHFLLLRGADHPLKEFYPTLGGPAEADLEQAFPQFRNFVLAHEDAVGSLIRARVTNTNEIGRSALLHPGFRALATLSPKPLYLIEVGPSAGLNLLWDRYGVRYMRDGATSAELVTGAPLVLDCALRGVGTPPAGPTPIVDRRIGLELNPVNLRDRDDCDWLRALIFPTEVARLRRLEKALAMFDGALCEIRHGDALELLPDAMAEASPDQTLCVYHTIVLYQFSQDMREALEAMLIAAGLRRTVFRLGFEFDGSAYTLSLERHADGGRDVFPLAISHPHGRWIEWIAPDELQKA